TFKNYSKDFQFKDLCSVFTTLPTKYFPYLFKLTIYVIHIASTIVTINLYNMSSNILSLKIVILFKKIKCNKYMLNEYLFINKINLGTYVIYEFIKKNIKITAVV